MYRKILVGYDGSAAGRKAFETALELAAKDGAELYVLSVARPPEVGDDVETEALFGDHAQKLRRRKGLGRVEDLAAAAHCGHVLRRPLTDRRLVVHVERRAVRSREIGQVATAHLHVAGRVDPVRNREEQLAAF